MKEKSNLNEEKDGKKRACPRHADFLIISA
jgi:hypothetical protein